MKARAVETLMEDWHRAASISQVSEGAPHALEIDGTKIGLFAHEGEIFAIGNICTHAFALLTNGFQEGCLVECPLHAGFFDVRTGKAQGTPVEQDVDSYETRIEDGWIFVRLPVQG